MVYRQVIDATSYVFDDLRDLLAKATPPRSGDRLAGIAADSAEQMVAARIALANVPLKQFLNEAVIPHEFDDAKGITASILDGILLGSGDACIGINPASDDPAIIGGLLRLLDDIIARLQIPTQGCVLTHVTTTLGLIRQGMPVDLVFQSIAGTEAANRSFGVDLALLRQAHHA